MNALQFRTRAAVLWVAAAVAVAGSLLLYLFEPGALEGMLAGEMEGETLTDGWGFFFATLASLPLVMAAVTLLLRDRMNRYVNSIGGLAFGLFGAYAFVGHLAAGDFNGHVLMLALAGALAFLIAGLGVAGLRRPMPGESVQVADESRPREMTTV